MSRFAIHCTESGVQIVRAERELEVYPRAVCDDLVSWALRRPDTTFLAQRNGADWTTIDFRETLARVRAISGGLLRSCATPQAPLAVIAENSIEHALVALGAMYAGIPVSPLSVGYASSAADPGRLRDLLNGCNPV